MAGAPGRSETVLRAPVWSARLRAAHWLMAVGVGALLGTGWLFAAGFGAPDYAVLDTHRATGYVLLAAVVFRVYLLARGRGAEGWADCIPAGTQRDAARGTLRFYLSLGRGPLPAWYAHNPAWGPVYLALFALLAATAITGILGLAPAHGALAGAVAVLAGLHLAAVVLHDWRGGNADLSAMLNGKRVFVSRGPAEAPVVRGVAVRFDLPPRDPGSQE